MQMKSEKKKADNPYGDVLGYPHIMGSAHVVDGGDLQPHCCKAFTHNTHGRMAQALVDEWGAERRRMLSWPSDLDHRRSYAPAEPVELEGYRRSPESKRRYWREYRRKKRAQCT